MGKGQFDLGHYAPYFILVLFFALFTYGYFAHFFGQREADVYLTSLKLEDVFTAEKLLHCFSDPHTHRFDESRFTEDTLKQCVPRTARATFKRMDNSDTKTLGDTTFIPDVVWREYVALKTGGGVLTFAFESV